MPLTAADRRRARAFCLTVQVADDESQWEAVFEDKFHSAEWSVRQLEVAPSTGQRHIQAAVYYASARSFSAVKKDFPGAHVESMRGTCQQSKDYCTKEDTRAPGTQPVETGTLPVQGSRNDLSSFCAKLEDGQSLRDVALADPATYVRYHAGLQKFGMLLVQPRSFMTETEILWGPTGSGKSTKVREIIGDTPYAQLTKSMVSSGGTVWFDNYDPIIHNILVIDDFYGWIPLHFFLNLIDSHPMTVQTKGGSVQFRCKKIYFTSNDDPKTWYSRKSEDNPKGANEAVYAAFLRRVTDPKFNVTHFVGYGPNKDLEYCPCTTSDCPLIHASVCAFASGVRFGQSLKRQKVSP
jgi:hypothetical protein